jgi:hypothetical protein
VLPAAAITFEFRTDCLPPLDLGALA